MVIAITRVRNLLIAQSSAQFYARRVTGTVLSPRSQALERLAQLEISVSSSALKLVVP